MSVPERQLTPHFGVELDVADASDDDLARRLRAAVADARVVRIRGLEWDERRQLEFSALLGTLLARPAGPDAGAQPHVRLERGGDRYADRWHADGSWARVDALSLLSCTEASPDAEPTMFLDTVTALRMLGDGRRADLAGRRIVHDLRRSRRRRPAGGEPSVPLDAARRVRHRLRRRSTPPPSAGLSVPVQEQRRGTTYPVIDHCPATGVDFLRLGDHAHSISGFGRRRSDELLAALHAEIDRPETTWQQDWQVGDLVVYDNRMVLHRRGGTAGSPAGRVLLRTMVEWNPADVDGRRFNPRRTV